MPLRRSLSCGAGSSTTSGAIRPRCPSCAHRSASTSARTSTLPSRPGCKIVGMSSEHGYRMGIAELAQRGGSHGFVVEPGPIEYATVHVGERTLVCVSAGLFFLRDGEAPLVALLGSTDHGMQQTLDI